MDKNESKEIHDLIRQLGRGIRKHGLKKVVSALKEISIVRDNRKKTKIVDFIENLVCERLGVPIHELFNFTTRGEITVARKLCILLIRNHLEDMSDDELGNHYNRSRQVIHNTEKEFRQLKSGKKNQFHLDVLTIYNELDCELKIFIKKLK